MSPCKTIGSAQRVVVKPVARWVLSRTRARSLFDPPSILNAHQDTIDYLRHPRPPIS